MKKNRIGLMLFFIQVLFTLACIVFCIMYFLGNKGITSILELTVAGDLIIMSICNALMKRDKKYTFIYLIVGIIMLIIGILNILGVI
ncbi:MAG: hypothetical protein IJ097_01245 [Bacilli bacterium]|nr:hypothetical protein [Bacilli bacterium]